MTSPKLSDGTSQMIRHVCRRRLIDWYFFLCQVLKKVLGAACVVVGSDGVISFPSQVRFELTNQIAVILTHWNPLDCVGRQPRVSWRQIMRSNAAGSVVFDRSIWEP